MSETAGSGRPCPAKGCTRRAKAGHLSCYLHWRALSGDVRRAITAAYYRHGVFSDEYVAALEQAHAEWNEDQS